MSRAMLTRVLLCLSLSLAACATVGPRPERPRAVAPAAGPWWERAVFYEIFVRSFADSDGDGVGDLRGLTAKLDTLNDGDPATTSDLGVDALWLTPIFEAPSDHGYDATDYGHVGKAYGTDADLDALLAQAHQRGIKVVLDLVLNHTSAQHPWFVESASSKSSPKRDWYVWSDTKLDWGQPWNSAQAAWHQKNGAWYYGVFWGGMPDLNYKNPQVQQAMTQVALDWLKRGADGFRLDAIRYLIETGGGKGQADVDETHAFLRSFAATLRAAKPDVALIGEVWAGTDTIAPYYGEKGDELTALFDFPLAMKLVNAVVAGDATLLSETLQDIAATYPKGAVDAPFLTNHDQTRVASVLKKNSAALGLAAALLLTLPGSPFLYYGEELGLANGPGNEDQWKRTPMPWAEGPGLGFTTGRPWHSTAPEQLPAPWSAQTNDPRSLLSRYRALLRARHASPALSTGELKLLEVGSSAALAFTRTTGEETVLVVHNFSPRPRVVSVPLAQPGRAEPLFLDELAAVERVGTGWSVSLPAQGTAVVRLQPPGG